MVLQPAKGAHPLCVSTQSMAPTAHSPRRLSAHVFSFFLWVPSLGHRSWLNHFPSYPTWLHMYLLIALVVQQLSCQFPAMFQLFPSPISVMTVPHGDVFLMYFWKEGKLHIRLFCHLDNNTESFQVISSYGTYLFTQQIWFIPFEYEDIQRCCKYASESPPSLLKKEKRIVHYRKIISHMQYVLKIALIVLIILNYF